MRWLCLRAALVLLTTSSFAHDLYLMPETFHPKPDSVLNVELHNGDAFPESEVSPVLERVRDMKLSSADGSVEVKNLRVESKAIRGDVKVPWRGGLILTVRTIPNAFTLDSKEFEAYLNEEGLSQVLEWRAQRGESNSPGRERYSKYAKSLISAGQVTKFHTKAAGMPIEIVPERSPADLKPGDSMPVRVLFKGEAASGLQIESAWAGPAGSKTSIVGHTDKEGRITVPLPSAGKWRFHTVRMERCSEPSVADWESYWASLTFELSSVDEQVGSTASTTKE